MDSFIAIIKTRMNDLMADGVIATALRAIWVEFQKQLTIWLRRQLCFRGKQRIR